MNERIAVFVAWPYANGDVHIGQAAGAYLPADIFARYHRLRGNRVLMVSGSDAHGTPITVQASQLGLSPQDVFQHYHRRFLTDWQSFGISFDLFTTTHSENHFRVSQDIFRRLYDRNYIYLDSVQQLYCPVDERFLPDRYVEGVCPHCGFSHARGDQCDNCGRLLDAVELIQPRCRICGSQPIPRDGEQFFFNLPALQQELSVYITAHGDWRPNVWRFASNLVDQGLQPRAGSRDMDWGIPVPIEGYGGKAIYVWFEAVIGYLSASIAWAERNTTPDAWMEWWLSPQARSYYFMGKDNIPFHTVIWPAELIADDRHLKLPDQIVASEFLNLEGRQFSTSRNWAVWLGDALSRYSADSLRYYLTAIAPELADTEFTWEGFVSRNNSELAAVWGNLVHRVILFAIKHWEGRVPLPGPPRPADQDLLRSIDEGFETVGAHYAEARPKAALREAIDLTRSVNRYLEDCGPWFEITSNREMVATTIYTALRAIDSLATLLAPVLPFSSERVRHVLGYDHPLFGVSDVDGHVLVYRPTPEEGVLNRWQPSQLPPGQALRQPEVLFPTVDEGVVAQERARLREARHSLSETGVSSPPPPGKNMV